MRLGGKVGCEPKIEVIMKMEKVGVEGGWGGGGGQCGCE